MRTIVNIVLKAKNINKQIRSKTQHKTDHSSRWILLCSIFAFLSYSFLYHNSWYWFIAPSIAAINSSHLNNNSSFISKGFAPLRVENLFKLFSFEFSFSCSCKKRKRKCTIKNYTHLTIFDRNVYYKWINNKCIFIYIFEIHVKPWLIWIVQPEPFTQFLQKPLPRPNWHWLATQSMQIDLHYDWSAHDGQSN